MHCCVHNPLPLDCILNWINPLHTFAPHFREIHLNVILLFMPRSHKYSLPSNFSKQFYMKLEDLTVVKPKIVCGILRYDTV
jgi:hypothetical protein